jgi:IS605 OrfB family transposase
MAGAQFKVLKLKIIKPVNMKWDDLGRVLRDARYRVYRLANLAVSEAYLQFHLWRTGRTALASREKPSDLNKRLRAMLLEEARKEAEKPRKHPAPNRAPHEDVPIQQRMKEFSKTGALPDTVTGALFMYKIMGLTSKGKWTEVLRGKSALPTFRNNMAIPIRCDKRGQKRLEQTQSGVELDLMVRCRPYPRVVLGTGGIGPGAEAVLERLLQNKSQAEDGYKQRYFEVKEDDNRTWWLFVTYALPAAAPPSLDPSRLVGVDLGFACPLYAAIGHGHARLGYRAFSSLAARIMALKLRTMRRRREIQRGGRQQVSAEAARSGHGRKRKLQGIEKLQGRINAAYTTLNHQMSAAVIRFALDNGAGTIQIEDLDGLRDKLAGTFLGQMWRYHQLQQFLAYKAAEHGIAVRKVNPRYTSQQCSQCGHINQGFTRQARDRGATPGYAARFECPACGLKADADYNAAKNLAMDGIEAIIEKRCGEQGIVL